MRRLVFFAALASFVAAAINWWRGHRRFGASYVNRVVDPWLVRQGIVEKSEGELALLEHVGRRSGTTRVTPVHPIPTETGFRIIVPLGDESQWAQNVLSAGHCRIERDGMIYELDEPTMVSPKAIEGIPPFAAGVMDWLGFRYLLLRKFAEQPGTLTATFEVGAEAEAPQPIEPEAAPAT